MKLEVGKRYVRRDGKISGHLENRTGDTVDWRYPFLDRKFDEAYTPDGQYYFNANGEYPLDLVAEYVEPSAEPETPASPDIPEPPDEIKVGTVVITDHNDVVKGIWRVTAVLLGGEGEEDLVELERLGMEDNATYGRAKVPRDMLRSNGWTVYP